MPSARAPKRFEAIGKRKSAIAHVFLSSGEGKIHINEREFENYFGRQSLRYIVHQPFEVTKTTGKYNVMANLIGGGPAGQADALKHGIAKALKLADPAFKSLLRNAGLLTRDSRVVERKKYGRRGARRRPQYSKR